MSNSGAKDAARAQERALKEQTLRMTQQSNEAARQSAATAANAAAREAASQAIEDTTMANKPDEVEVELSDAPESSTRRRSRFQASRGDNVPISI